MLFWVRAAMFPRVIVATESRISSDCQSMIPTRSQLPVTGSAYVP